MILTVAELLQELLERERRTLDETRIPHAPTIGGMYEGLSRDLLDRALPFEGLRVASGFVRDQGGRWSRQLDCMIVTGEGEPIPYQDARLFKLEEVAAVVEVKKNLYTAALEEGFVNLKSVLALDHERPPEVAAMVRRAFQTVTRSHLPADVDSLPVTHLGIYRSLATEAFWPARILLGYHGYRSVRSFRQGILGHLQALAGQPGWNAATLPSCVIGPGYAAVKNTAMPWGAPVAGGWWPLLMTTDRLSPAHVLLEIVWSRLNLLGLIPPEWFGEGLVNEAWDRLVDARARTLDHWELRSWPAERPAGTGGEPHERWSPWFVGQPAYVLATLLGRRFPEPLDVTAIGGPPAEIEAGVAELEAAGIAARDRSDPNRWYLLTDGCATAVLPDGRFAVAENVSGRLERWAERFMAEWSAGGIPP